MKFRNVFGALAIPLLVSSAGAVDFPRMAVSIGFHRIEVEVAATPEARAQGLMRRKFLPAQQGMLFVFTGADRHCMWMRNTLVPLAVAFMDDKGVILNVEEMQPQSDDNHCAAGPAVYALEMNSRWFRDHGYGAGARVAGIDRAPPPK